MVQEIGKSILGLGLILVLVGAALILASRFGFPIGRLPGDVAYKGKHISVYFPLGTSILLSILLSGILYLIARFRR